jgi:hypothetical protein
MLAVSYTTDLTHFLDERGAIPADLPKQAQQLAANLGEIVASVTVYTRENPKTNVSCWINKSKNLAPVKSRLDLIWIALISFGTAQNATLMARLPIGKTRFGTADLMIFLMLYLSNPS